jgi:hypothetical protein
MKNHLTGLVRNDVYRLYHSPYVVEHQRGIIEDAEIAYGKYQRLFDKGSLGTTWDYRKYNIFSLTARSVYFYVLYQQIVAACRDYVGDNRPLWMQCWLNRHLSHEVLSWHTHGETSVLHGYISIDPKNTVTEFKNFSIINKVGNMYLGGSGPDTAHCVKVLEPYDDFRITIAFDVMDHTRHNLTPNLAFIPIP